MEVTCLNLVLVRILNPCFTRRGVAVGKVVAHLCLTLIVKELKISVDQCRVVTILKYKQTLNIIFRLVDSKKDLVEV